MQVRFIGDVHGYYSAYERLIKDVPFSIQVGDMGVGFFGIRQGEKKALANPPFDKMAKGRHLFIRGNHDNPEVCKNHKFWIPDGTMVENVFCLGGAVSIDKAWRTEGWDWWSNEELSQEELDQAIEKYKELKPEIVCTHDCPESIANQILATFNWKKIEDGSRTRQALDVMFFHHQPKYWVFGHWHNSLKFAQSGTIFQCLNELEFVDVDLDGV